MIVPPKMRDDVAVDEQLPERLLAARDRLLNRINDGEFAVSSEQASARETGSVAERPTVNVPVSIDPQPEPNARLRPGELFDQRYRIEQLIGEGGAAQVFRAHHIGTDKSVALKVLSASRVAHPVARKRFLREARVTAALTHEHIVQVIDAGLSAQDLPYVAMELLHGQSLSQHLHDHGALDWLTVRRLLAQLCAALEVAHAHGVVHRDLKPENIVVITGAGGELNCKLIDFGLARRDSTPELSLLSRHGESLGTPTTMSPEQVRGEGVTPASDIYALGCVIHRMVTNEHAFAAVTATEFATAHLFATPKRISEHYLPHALRAKIQALVDRCLAKHPKQRFASVSELRAELEKLDSPPNDEPPQAPGPIPHKSRFFTRTALLAIVAAIAGSVVVTRFSTSAVRQPQQITAPPESAALPQPPTVARPEKPAPTPTAALQSVPPKRIEHPRAERTRSDKVKPRRRRPARRPRSQRRRPRRSDRVFIDPFAE